MIEWRGMGEPAVGDNELVRVRFRGGETSEGKAHVFYWRHDGSSSDIVAWEFADTAKFPFATITPGRGDARSGGSIAILNTPYGGNFGTGSIGITADGPIDESKRRKLMPIVDGCFLYFPDALLAVAEHSRKANEKHNPGEQLHWSKHKSNDHANCIGRHLLDAGPDWSEVDPEFDSMHVIALAWRALAMAQITIEAKGAGMTPRDYLKKLEKEAA